MTQTSFAFLLVKFQDINDEPMTKSEAEQMFTAAGSGSLNVVDWFHENTHGHIDMTANQVFGWLTLTEHLMATAPRYKVGPMRAGRSLSWGVQPVLI